LAHTNEYLQHNSSIHAIEYWNRRFLYKTVVKPHTVALALLADPSNPRPNRDQAYHNDRVARNVLTPLSSDVLTTDEKTVIQLLIQQNSIGTALRRHGEKGAPLDEIVADANQELDRLREQCPPDYRERFDDYLVVSYLADAGAHTQRARYKAAETGEIMVDVTDTDRYNPDGSGNQDDPRPSVFRSARRYG